MRTLAAAAFVTWLGAAALPASARGPAFLVRDIKTLPDALGSRPRDFVTVGGVAYFFAERGREEPALWRTDGTPAGTRLVKRFPGEVELKLPSDLTAVGNQLFFIMKDEGVLNPTLWRSDGTEAGTYSLDVPAFASTFTDVDGTLFFVSGTLSPRTREALFKTDGTREGTVLVKSFPLYSRSLYLAALDGRLYFAHTEQTRSDLWTSDGTEAGTVPSGVFPALPVDADSRPSFVTAAGGRLFFLTSNLTWEPFTATVTLWASDATPAGTMPLKEFTLPSVFSLPPIGLTAVGETLYFAVDDGEHGAELWTSDGSSAGTVLIRDAVSGPKGLLDYYCQDYCVPFVVSAAGEIFFTTWQPTGYEVWRSDGTDSGTRRLAQVADPREDVSGLAQVPGRLIFLSRMPSAVDEDVEIVRLWATGSEVEAPVLLREFGPSDGRYEEELTVLDGVLLFATNDGVHGRELWQTDGTAGGTALLADLYGANGGSKPSRLAAVDGAVYFFADDGLHGFELHRSDGRAADTRLVRDINPGPADGFQAYLSAPRPTALGGEVYFAADDGQAGVELWKSDGTESGTVLVKDVRPGPNGSFPAESVAVGETLFFIAQDRGGQVGAALWRTDGTEAGTHRVTDRLPAEGNPSSLVGLNGTLFFLTRDRLWRSDGTESGTTIVAAVPSVETLAAIGDRLFLGAAGNRYDRGLWTSDGTPLGTMRQRVIEGTPALFTTAAGTVFFATRGGSDEELWKTDGTPGGTQPVSELEDPEYLVDVGGLLLFAATHGVLRNQTFYRDRELWRSDGTYMGTVRVRDVNPGDAHSEPRYVTAVGERAVFAAEDGITGRELWATDGTEEGTSA
jgi:ELWxxDGT repeat protein